MLDRKEFNDLFALVESVPTDLKQEVYKDIDVEEDSVATWEPIISDGKIIAVVGAAKENDRLWSGAVFPTLMLTVFLVAAFVVLELLFLKRLEKTMIHPIMEEEAAILSYMETKDSEDAVSRLEKIRSQNEIGALAVSFSGMIQEIDRYVEEIRSITTERERIDAELNTARQIQLSMCPQSLTGYTGEPGFEIIATMQPAKEVGGDFYDYFVIDDDHIGLTIGDVSGKGVPAALFMAVCKTLLKNTAKDNETPADIISKVNGRLCENNPDMMFVTVWLGIYTVSSRELCYVNAGHEYPAIYRAASGRYELIVEEHDMVLGFDPDICYKEHTISLQPGDRLFVYTDGVPEATNKEEELYDTDRMLSALNATSSDTVRAGLDALRSDIDRFTDGAEQFDDITMLCFVLLSGN